MEAANRPNYYIAARTNTRGWNEGLLVWKGGAETAELLSERPTYTKRTTRTGKQEFSDWNWTTKVRAIGSHIAKKRKVTHQPTTHPTHKWNILLLIAAISRRGRMRDMSVT